MSEADVERELWRLRLVMVGPDLIGEERGAWVAGPSALSLLLRATVPAHLRAGGDAAAPAQ